MAKPFQFKQFKIHQDKCAMKVGTDGVLLGAWVNVKNTNSVLDIGTGTGVIALMLAQRNSMAKIQAIEIDIKAANQSEENFKASNWKERLKVVATSLQNYATKATEKFDLLISNPPFYSTKKFTLAQGDARLNARNTAMLTFEELVINTSKLMHNNSRLALIIPIEALREIENILNHNQLYINRLMKVKPTHKKAVHRILLEASFFKTELQEENLVIQHQERNNFTNDYIKLTRDFYTIM